MTFSKVSFHVSFIWNGIVSTLSKIPAIENIIIHHTNTSGRTFLLIQESDIESASHLDVIASNSLLCWSYINCCNLTLSSAGASDLVISAIASFGDVTPRNTFPKVGLITDAAPNNNCPTVVSLNFLINHLLFERMFLLPLHNLLKD
jgi:hypothetical protein